MIPIDMLIKPPTEDEVFNKILDTLETVQIPARSWRDGGVARSVLGVIARLGSDGAALITDAIAGFFIFFAKGVYLTAHVKDVYDVDRIAATFATSVDATVLTNNGGAVYNVGADELIVSSSITGARFRVTQAFVLNANSSLKVSVSAIESGSGSSVAIGAIDTLETPLTKVTVTNIASIIGRDEESDDALRQRALAKKGTWSPFGPRDAYEYAALSATIDGVATSITRVSVSRSSSTNEVTIVCATPNGTPTSDELDAVRTNVELIARADTVKVTVLGATPVATTHVITVWARGGVEATLRSNAENALALMIAGYPIGGIAKTDGGQGYLFAEKIAATVIGSSIEVFDVDLDDNADIPLDFDEVATNTTTFDVRIR